MPRGRERILTYVRERDSAGREVVRAVEVRTPAAPPAPAPCTCQDSR